jgi:hypothetical protein
VGEKAERRPRYGVAIGFLTDFNALAFGMAKLGSNSQQVCPLLPTALESKNANSRDKCSEKIHVRSLPTSFFHLIQPDQ